MTTLESRLNMTLARLRVIEEVLHGHHEWHLCLANQSGSVKLRAVAGVFEEGIRFLTLVPIPMSFSAVSLEMDGATVLVMADDQTFDNPHVYIWELTVENPLTVG